MKSVGRMNHFFSESLPPILFIFWHQVQLGWQQVSKHFGAIPFINKKVLLIKTYFSLVNVRLCVTCAFMCHLCVYVSHVRLCVTCAFMCHNLKMLLLRMDVKLFDPRSGSFRRVLIIYLSYEVDEYTYCQDLTNICPVSSNVSN